MTTIYFDFETGGVEPGHPNISLAALVMRDGLEIETAHWLIQFDRATAQQEALDINHYDEARWAGEAVTERRAAVEFAALLERHKTISLTSAKGTTYGVARLAGYNCATFDGPRLQTIFDLYNLFPPWRRPTLDIMQLALEYADNNGVLLPNNKLSTVAEHFGIATDGAHDALADCRMTAQIHARIRGATGNLPAAAGA